jgi:hypothetical protein
MKKWIIGVIIAVPILGPLIVSWSATILAGGAILAGIFITTSLAGAILQRSK